MRFEMWIAELRIFPLAISVCMRADYGMTIVKMKVTFDNNFLDRFHKSAPEDRNRIFSYVETGKLEFYANLETLREVMGLSQTTRSNLIVPFVEYILKLTSGKILYDIDDMLALEFCGAFQLLIEEQQRKQIIIFLKQAASGHIPSAAQKIGQHAIEDKKKAKEQFDIMYLNIENQFVGIDVATRAKISFDKIRTDNWNNTCKRTVRAICADRGIPDPDKVSEAVFNDNGSYPHFRTYMKIFALMLYQYFVLCRRRDEGDLFDFKQMVYLQDMDVYVTNERKLQEWYYRIFDNTRQVITAEQFLVADTC